MEKSIFEMMDQKQFTTNNGTIVYWISKCQSKYTLVFLHGLTADHTLFEKQIAFFCGQFNLFCWDTPAHGKSRPFSNFTYSNAAKNLKDILEKEQFENLFFIGQSMGGYITQTYIKRYPNTVKGFVAIDSCPFGEKYYSKFDKWCLRQIEWMSLCFSHQLLKKSIAKSCAYTKSACQNMMTALQPYSKRELCHLMGIGYTEFLQENCDIEITCPTVILVGEYDKTGKVKQYCTAWSKNTSYPLYVIPKAAHNSNFDNSEVVNQKIDKFIQELLQ